MREERREEGVKKSGGCGKRGGREGEWGVREERREEGEKKSGE